MGHRRGRDVLASALLVPVAAAAGGVALALAAAWNELAGAGGALLVGVVAALGLWALPNGDDK